MITNKESDGGLKMFNQKVLLIDPPFFRFMDENQPNPPLGLAYLAGYLVNKGFSNVVIYNADFNPFERLGECNCAYAKETTMFGTYKKRVQDLNHPLYAEVMKTIAEQKPAVIGISSKTAKFFIIKNIVGMIKEKYKQIPIVIGGPHSTALPQETLERTQADFVVRGEGEETFYELLKAIFSKEKKYDKVDGISLKKDGQVIHNKDRPYIQDIDAIPFPRKDLMLFREHVDKDKMGGIFSSRGCPFNCAFCDARTTWSRRVRKRSPQNIVDEVIFTKKKYGTSFFSFSDDCFITDKKHTFAFCELLIKNGLPQLPRKDFRRWCEIHPNLITNDVISKIKEAGCVAVAIGVESGSQKTLDRVHKGTTKDIIRNAVQVIKDNGIEVGIYCIIGFPWETVDDIDETISFMKELQPDSENLSILTPLPSTEIYDDCLKLSLIDYDQDYLNCFHQRASHFYSEHINDAESRKIVKKAFSEADEYTDNNRMHKLVNYIRQAVVPGISQGKSRAYEKIFHQVNQDYSKRTVILTFKNGINEKIMGKAAKMILNGCPQYLKVEVKSQDGKIKKTFGTG